jgi:protein arginine kinase activator
VFEEVLVQELLRENIPERVRKMQENTKKPYLHVGKTPVQEADISSASRIVNLNEALKEALNKENYEQAAWLRDQIKALTDKKQASDL